MLRRSVSVFMMIILLALAFGPLDVAKAQSPDPVCPPFNSANIQDELFLKSLPPECAKSYQKLMKMQSLEDEAGAVTSLTVGDPDTFGYTYTDTISDPPPGEPPLLYDWQPASTDTGLTGDDKVSLSPIDIGFSFPFYGLNYSQLFYNTNGGITFGSGSNARSASDLPLPSTPNNLIAPFWGDLVVHNYDTGGVVNDGAIYYTRGGTAPDRFFILEWRGVETYEDLLKSTFSPFSFEVILYENGNIVTQIQSLPQSYNTTVGIENSLGDEGLQYQQGDTGLSTSLAVRFNYPSGVARVQVSPLYAGQFSVVGETNQFELTIANTGNWGIDDTYDLTVSSPWSAALYASDGTTLLTDTDSDGTVDTGPVLQSASVTIIAKIDTPVSAIVGNANTATITATSSNDLGKSKTSTLQNAVPAPFAQIYRDGADNAMSLELVYPDAQTVKKVTPDGYYGIGNEMAVAVAPNGNYIYVWSKQYCPNIACTDDVYEIEYAILDHFGNTVLAKTKLTDNSGAIIRTYDRLPSVVVAPNGTVGIVWQSYLINSPTSKTYNIYFATLDSTGYLLNGPTNITNNANSGSPSYGSPAVTASDDNQFILAWQEDAGGKNVWYAVRDAEGANVFSPAALTSDGTSVNPVLNSLKNGKSILTWVSGSTAIYAILNSDGSVITSSTALGAGYAPSPYTDAVLMPNGKIAVTWTKNMGVQFAILDSSYVLSDPISANNPFSLQGYGLSVTTNSSNDVIMTWRDGTTAQNLFYALGTSSDPIAFVTQPMLYMSSAKTIYTSYNGQGNAPLKMPASVVSVKRANINPTLAPSVDFTVTFSDPVTGVDTAAPFGDFILTTTGVSDASVSGVTAVSGSVYTVTVNTGSGSGTIRLDVVDNDSILDAALNKLGGPGEHNGDYPSGETYTVDKIAPTVESVARANVNPTFASSVDFTVTFSDSVTNVDVLDFVVTHDGVPSATVKEVTAVSGSVYTVTVNTGDSNSTGAIRLDVVISDDTIRDTAGNLLDGSYASGETYLVDKVVPTMGTFTVPTPSKSFNIPLTAFTASDNIAVTGYLITTSPTPPAVDAPGWTGTAPTTYTVSTIGSFTLYPWVKDAAGNVSAVFVSPRAVVVDLPIVLSITRVSTNPTKAKTVKFTVTFSKPVTGVDKTDFALGVTGISSAKVLSVAGKGSIYTVTVNTGSGTGTLRLNVNDNDSIKDAAATPLGGTGTGNGAFVTGDPYTVDKTKPMPVSIVLANPALDYTNASTVSFIVTFSEAVTGVDIKDFKLTKSGGMLKPMVVSVSGLGTTYTVTVNTGVTTTPGTVRLDLINNKSIKDAALNPLGAIFKTGQVFHKN